MYAFIEEKFRDVYEKYANSFTDSEYAYYLESVSNNGLAIFDVPIFYLTDEMVMRSIETPNKPLFMMTKNELEEIKQNRILQELGKIYNSNTYHYISEQSVIEINKKFDIKNYRFEDIMCLKYKKYLNNHYLDGLYTFVDFFNQVWMFYEGLDMICYAYLYRGIPIPIKIKNTQNNRRQKYKLVYDNKTKTLHRIKIVHQEYQTLRSNLNAKLDSYYKYSNYKYLDEYSWNESPTGELNIPLFQDGEIYSTLKTISDEYGVTYDISRSYIIDASKDLEEYNVPESVSSIRPKAFMNCTRLKKIVITSKCEIKEAAFMNCSSLGEVLLPDVENDYDRLWVFSAAFCNCTSLLNMDFSKIELRDGCATFANCYSLKSIVGLKISSCRATFTFYHCNNLNQLPSNISTYDFKDFAFAFCCNIEEINIDGLEISYGCFCGCSNLKLIHFSRDQSIEFGEYSFAECKKLERLDLREKQFIRIYNHAFSNCTSLKLLIMPKNENLPIEISETAFTHCNTNELMLQWGIEGYTYPIDMYIQKEKNRIEEENRITISATKKFKQRFFDTILNLKKVSENDSERNKILGDFYNKEGEYLGHYICNMFKFSLCSWEEYFYIAKFFYKSIHLSEIGNAFIRATLVLWASYCAIQSYLQAPIHQKKYTIRLLFNILCSAYYPFQDSLITTQPLSTLVYKDKWQIKHYICFDMLHLHLFMWWNFDKIQQKANDSERTVIKLISSFQGDAMIISLLKFRLLSHLLSINSISNEPNWNIKAMNEEYHKTKSFLIDRTGATEKILRNISSYMWLE